MAGFGLALARNLLQNTKLNIIATTSSGASKAREAILSSDIRDGSAADRLTTIEMDVTSEKAVEHASQEVSERFGRNLRLLVNVSGVVSRVSY